MYFVVCMVMSLIRLYLNILTISSIYICYICSMLSPYQDPAGYFDLVEVVGNGTYGQVYKVNGTAIIYVINSGSHCLS